MNTRETVKHTFDQYTDHIRDWVREWFGRFSSEAILNSIKTWEDVLEKDFRWRGQLIIRTAAYEYHIVWAVNNDPYFTDRVNDYLAAESVTKTGPLESKALSHGYFDIEVWDNIIKDILSNEVLTF